MPKSSTDVEKRYSEWISDGLHGSMDYLEHHSQFKVNPKALLPDCKSLIVVGLGYNQEDGRPIRSKDIGIGKIAKYAWGRDYHKVMKKKLKSLEGLLKQHYPKEEFLVGSDATPLLETHFAVKGGIGFRGKHTLVINDQLGSWFFIGEVLTTLSFNTSFQKTKRCGIGCNFCIDICPTKAIVAPYKLDARKCISYLTIEHRGPIPEYLRPAIGNWVFGCDLCQDVCPWNVRAKKSKEVDFLNWNSGSTQSIDKLLSLRDHHDMVSFFAGSPLMRAGRERLVRNACTVAGNQKIKSLLPKLRVLSTDNDRGISEHARWAVNIISKQKDEK